MSERLNHDTFCKIFQAFGKDGIDEMEEKVDDFLNDKDSPIHVISIAPQMCSIGNGQDEIYQTMTITIWYRYLRENEINAIEATA
ncbi:hypothetical protein ATN81_11765 [Agrobacterium pusense]|uniref:hypothetical protein n=1 Tax=Agrobacterium pusense TaxID=648995 RepID=UPI0009293CFF|nr:hypothetical protein [Agrobacterium pusense]OJH54929.1 hypothetical protein ATN81_11765 [Agrobacterium pusense]OJH59246.1 hypothetical protein BA725_13365 [Agrobacterium pusense]